MEQNEKKKVVLLLVMDWICLKYKKWSKIRRKKRCCYWWCDWIYFKIRKWNKIRRKKRCCHWWWDWKENWRNRRCFKRNCILCVFFLFVFCFSLCYVYFVSFFSFSCHEWMESVFECKLFKFRCSRYVFRSFWKPHL